MQPYLYTICIGSLTSILRSLKETLKEEEVNKDFTDEVDIESNDVVPEMVLMSKKVLPRKLSRRN